MKVDKNYKEDFLKNLETVLTVKAACEKTGIARQTVYRWMRDDKQFAKDSKEAVKNCILDVNDDCESRILTKIKSDDMQAIKFWLRFHHGDYKQSYVITKLGK